MSGLKNGITQLGIDDDGSPVVFVLKRLAIGDWNMNASGGGSGSLLKSVNHGLSATEWKTVSEPNIVIRNDADTVYYKLLGGYDGVTTSGIFNGWNVSFFALATSTASVFDSASFNSTSYNRGWISFLYIPD
jgi:hypothetical protein